MLPYLIALDDVIDLPQVVAATCFVADLQQHQAYFLLSQFSRSDSAFLSSLEHAERDTEEGEGGNGRVGQRERRGDGKMEGVSLDLDTTSGWGRTLDFREGIGG